MKISFLFYGLLLLSLNKIYGQDTINSFQKAEIRPSVLSVGLGYSEGFAIIAIRTATGSGLLGPTLYNEDLVQVSSTPAITGSFEHSIDKRISLGVAASYQSYHVADVYYQPSNTGFTRINIDNHDVYTRINIAGRCLYHIVNKSNLDSYYGIRVGYTIWNLSTMNPDPGYKQRNSITSLPSVQVLYGLKYYYGNYGIGFELGLGTAPYLAMANLNYRFGHIKEDLTIGSTTLFSGNVYREKKEAYLAYRAKILPADKKNIIKLNLTTNEGIGLAYERYLKNGFSLELGSLFQFYNSLQSALANINNTMNNTPTFTEHDSLKKGIKIYGLVKYYLTATRFTFPKGCYLGASYCYINSTTLVHVADLAAVKNPVSFDYEKNIEQNIANFLVGCQLPFAKHFTMDLSVGIMMSSTSLKSVKYIDTQASEEKFASYFGEHKNSLYPQKSPANLNLSIGYMF